MVSEVNMSTERHFLEENLHQHSACILLGALWF